MVRSAFAAFEDGDLDRLRGLVTDDVIVYRAEPDGATSHGLDGFLQLTAEWTEGFRDWTPVPEEFTDAGERVLVRVRQSALGEASGNNPRDCGGVDPTDMPIYVDRAWDGDYPQALLATEVMLGYCVLSRRGV